MEMIGKMSRFPAHIELDRGRIIERQPGPPGQQESLTRKMEKSLFRATSDTLSCLVKSSHS